MQACLALFLWEDPRQCRYYFSIVNIFDSLSPRDLQYRGPFVDNKIAGVILFASVMYCVRPKRDHEIFQLDPGIVDFLLFFLIVAFYDRSSTYYAVYDLT
jgi:glycerol uptake facilitator-like aquaporin